MELELKSSFICFTSFSMMMVLCDFCYCISQKLKFPGSFCSKTFSSGCQTQARKNSTWILEKSKKKKSSNIFVRWRDFIWTVNAIASLGCVTSRRSSLKIGSALEFRLQIDHLCTWLMKSSDKVNCLFQTIRLQLTSIYLMNLTSNEYK